MKKHTALLLYGLLSISMISVVFTGCKTSKTTPSGSKIDRPNTISAPEGVTFKTFTDYKDLALINIPMSGNGFKAENEQPDRILPTVRYGNTPVTVWTGLENMEGTPEQQFNKVKRQLYLLIKDNSIIDTKKITVGRHEALLIEVTRDIGTRGYSSLHYGYLIIHNNKGLLLFVKDGYLTPETDKAAFKRTIDEVFKYMIATLKYKQH